MKGCTLFLILLVTVAVAHADPRQWNHAGLAVHQSSFLDWNRATACDDAGNTLVLWSDVRSGDREVYAQLINSEGFPQWADSGVNVSRSPGQQETPVACAVDGGWVIAWVTYRGDGYNSIRNEEEPIPCGGVWATRLDHNGHPVWSQGGVPVDTSHTWALEGSLRIESDGSGGAIMAWFEGRTSMPNILYAQHVLSSGQIGWPNLMQLAHPTVFDALNELNVTGDSHGDMLLAWTGYPDSGYTNIYAAKITPAGDLPWGGTNGLLVCGAGNDQILPDVCSDSEGGCYIAWRDRRTTNTDIYIQHVDSSGLAIWTPDGIALCDAAGNQDQVRLATSVNGSSSDGCVAVWEDARVNGYCNEIYAQKVSPLGTILWMANGLKVCGNARQDSAGYGGQSRDEVRVVSDLAGGLVCTWEDLRAANNYSYTSDLYAERVLSDGSLSWNPDCGNLVADGPQAQNMPVIGINGDGPVIIYGDARTGGSSVRVQKLTLQNGMRLLPNAGVVLMNTLDWDATNPHAIAMTQGRTAIVWENNLGWRGSGLYYQIVTNSGQMEKPPNGVALVTDNSGGQYLDQRSHQLCTDGTGGFFVAYVDLRTGAEQIRLSHVNSAGNVVGSPAGTIVWLDSTTADEERPFCVPDGAGGCFVAWSAYNLSYVIDLYIMRMSADCRPLWHQALRLTNTVDDDIINGLISNPGGSCTMVWQSGPYANYDISAATVRGDGNEVYYDLVCTATGNQTEPEIVADGSGGAYIAWTDGRDVAHSGNMDIYAQHLNALGVPYWANNGIRVSPDSLLDEYPKLALCGDGSLCVVWAQGPPDNGSRLFAQKITASGSLLWPEGGVEVSDSLWYSWYRPAIIPDNGNGAFIAWSSYSQPSWQIYATHLNADGNPVGDPYWVVHQGGRLTDPTNQDQYIPSLVSDGYGGFVAAWADCRGSSYYQYPSVYAQHVADAAGTQPLSSHLPKTYSLSQNYPNPFNPTTVISFALPKAGMTTLRVYGILGRQVNTLVDRVMPAGNHTVSFDASCLASGIYFYRLESGSFSNTKKMVLLK